MAQSPYQNLLRRIFSTIALISVLVLPLLLILLPPDGTQRAAWAQFIGRFHPLAVHLPIALILLVPLLELAGRKPHLSHLQLSVPFVLALALATAIAAAFLGWCLARSEGFSGKVVTQHMWGAAVMLVLCAICWIARADDSRWRSLYPIALAATVVAVAFTGYRGGQLSFGEDHLTKLLPVLFGANSDEAEPGASDPNTFYGARIQPIFTAQCLTCHSAAKRKGGLQLTSYSALMRGGKHGTVVKTGDASGSALFHRITLPASDDNFMPKGKSALSADQIKLIELWIAAGASGTATADSIAGAPASPASTAATEITFPEVNPEEIAKKRAAIAPAVAQVQRQFPNVLEYESRNSADLVLDASVLGEKFGDGELAAFAPLEPNIVIADLSRTSVTDKSRTIIAGMKRLRVLRLVHTKVGDETLEAIAGLDQLESLSVFDTRTTSKVLPTIAAMKHLRYFYAGQTGISSASVPAALKDKVVF